MKRIWLLAILLGAWASAGVAQTTAELVNDAETPEDVLIHSMGYDRTSYSPLNEINRSTAHRLVPIWNTSVMNGLGELAAPSIYNGVMYVINGQWTFALDVATGRQIWRTPVTLEEGTRRRGINRGGPVLYEGKLFRVTADNHVLALDMETGEELWNQKFADFNEGYYATGAPLVANGVLISGMSGGESTTRGFLDGWDPDTGAKLWRRHTIPGPGEPGFDTWPQDTDAWRYGGAPTWRSGSYDPELDLVYWGTGNAEPYDPEPRGALDSLFTSSVLAIRPQTGEIACFYQYTPNDVYDVDGTDEHTLVDLEVDGELRQVMIQPNKNGFLYVLDRTDCSLIAAHPFVHVNWATHIDLETGRPVLTDLYERFLAGEEVSIFPSRSTNAVPIAVNPNTGLVYATTWHVPRIQQLARDREVVIGGNSTLVNNRFPEVEPGDLLGHIIAMDPLTGEKVWEVPTLDFPISAGVLATGGGLVFIGRPTGEFMALDEATGDTVWQFQTGSSINSTAITYVHDGRQYMTVASGLGGGLANRYAAGKMPTGGSIWTFALMPE
ncbi:MAG: PQQ-binding-like beta-propeller repeat protein [Acidobacteriota bacterium]|nr:PQQ-binding-like beta-propeller repeat protein [Acidobacteriota bacterium]